MRDEFAIIKDGRVFHAEAPQSAKISTGNRAMNVDLDILSVDGEMYSARHLLVLARTCEKRLRLIGFESLAD